MQQIVAPFVALYELEVKSTSPGPLGTVRIRHKQPEADTATESAFAMAAPPAASFAAASPDLRFAFSVAAFADVLRGGATWSLDQIRDIASGAASDDKDRNELVSLIDRARKIAPPTQTVAQ